MPGEESFVLSRPLSSTMNLNFDEIHNRRAKQERQADEFAYAMVVQGCASDHPSSEAQLQALRGKGTDEVWP